MSFDNDQLKRLAKKWSMEDCTPLPTMQSAHQILQAWGEERPLVTPECISQMMELLDKRTLITRGVLAPFRSPCKNRTLRWLFFYQASKLLGFRDYRPAFLGCYRYDTDGNRFPKALKDLLELELWPDEYEPVAKRTRSLTKLR